MRASPGTEARTPGTAPMPDLALSRRWNDASDHARGVAFMLVSVAGYSVMSVCVKAVSSELPTMQIVFVRSLGMSVLTWGLLRGAGVSLLGVARWTLLGRAAAGATALSLYYFGLSRLPLGDATTVFYTSPVWTALAAALLLGERLRPVVLGGAAVSLVGVALVAQPSFLGGEALDGLGLASVTGAALLSALAYTAVRKLRETDHAYTIVFYLCAVGAIGALPFAAGGAWVWPSPHAWALLAGLGAGTQIAQIALTHGLHLLEAGRATAIGYAQVVLAFGWGIVLFGETPSALAIAGAILIVASTVAVSRR